MNTGEPSSAEYVVMMAFVAFIGLYTGSVLAALLAAAIVLLIKEL